MTIGESRNKDAIDKMAAASTIRVEKHAIKPFE
jgi:hypothetical protein